MKHQWFAACLAAVAAGMAVASTSVPAAMTGQPDAEKASTPITLQQAVDQAQKDTGGRVLAADTIRSRHGSKYRIKVLTSEGRVRVIEMNSLLGPTPEAKGAKHTNKEKQ